MLKISDLNKMKDYAEKRREIDFSDINGKIGFWSLNAELVLIIEEIEKEENKKMFSAMQKHLKFNKGVDVKNLNESQIANKFLQETDMDSYLQMSNAVELVKAERFIESVENAPSIEDIKNYYKQAGDCWKTIYEDVMKKEYKKYTDAFTKYREFGKNEDLEDTFQ